MGHRLLAVLVRAATTVASADHALDEVLLPLLRAGVIDSHILGGQVTGAWNPSYDRSMDPRNWRPCSVCAGGTHAGRGRCGAFGDAIQAGRLPGTELVCNAADRAAHPGDIVTLGLLLDPGWRFPKGRTPIAWVDLAGIVWPDNELVLPTRTDTGDLTPRLRQVLDELITGRRTHSGLRQPFTVADYAVAVVDAYH